jgi:putative transposase
VKANQARFPVYTMCRVLEVSRSGYYAWRGQPISNRAREDAALTEHIRAIHTPSDANYGSPNIHAELRDQGTRVGRKRVARLMRKACIRGVSRRRGFIVTTHQDSRYPPGPDLVQRQFVAEGPNRLWVADITYVPTWAGFIFLAIVLDVWSRRIVGWAIGEQMNAQLVLTALNMALARRRPKNVIHHSDR